MFSLISLFLAARRHAAVAAQPVVTVRAVVAANDGIAAPVARAA